MFRALSSVLVRQDTEKHEEKERQREREQIASRKEGRKKEKNEREEKRNERRFPMCVSAAQQREIKHRSVTKTAEALSL